MGEAVFIRTDTPDYAEETMPFTSLEEMVSICSACHPNLTLERIIIHSMAQGVPCALTLGFVAASRGRRPDFIQVADG